MLYKVAWQLQKGVIEAVINPIGVKVLYPVRYDQDLVEEVDFPVDLRVLTFVGGR